MAEAAAASGFEIIRVEALDGGAIDQKDWRNFDKTAFERRKGRTALPGEYGCYQSHLKALQAFVDSNRPHCVILEDDILPGADSAARVNALLEAMPQFDVIRLASHRTAYFIQYAASSEGDDIGRTVFGPQGSAAAYLVSREGAQKILSALAVMTLPWDNALERFWASQTNVFATRSDVFVFSRERENSTIVAGKGYAAARFGALKRFEAVVFELKEAFLRAHHVLLPPALPIAASSRQKDPARASKPSRAEYLVILLLLLFVSAMWVETDTYRVAGLALILLGLVHYARSDLRRYGKVLVGPAGFLCFAWFAYVASRMGFAFFTRTGKGFGTAEGIYLLPLLYPTFGYAMFTFIRRPFTAAAAFLSTSLIVLVASTDYARLLSGDAAVTILHNNRIHAANACGFILICAFAFGNYAAKELSLPARTRAACVIAAAATFGWAAMNVIAFDSKGVWLALAAAVPLLLAVSALEMKSRRNWALVLAAVIALGAGLGSAQNNIVQVAGPTAELTLELAQDVAAGDGLEQSMSKIIETKSTPVTIRERLMIWDNAAEIWAKAPLFGSGVTWLDDWEHRKYTESKFTLLHNGYFEIAVRYGIFGLTFYAVLFGWALKTVARASREELIDRTAWHAYLAAFVFFAISLATNSNIRLAFGESYMWFAASFAFYCQYKLQEKNGTRPRTYC